MLLNDNGQRCTKAGRHVPVENKFCVVAPNSWVSSAWQLLHITLLESRIFEEATTHFWKIYSLLDMGEFFWSFEKL